MMHAARRIWLAMIAIAAFAGPSVADDALGQPAPARVALVIGNTAYTLAPALPACAASANLVADRLEAAGFDVDERLDATNGPMGAALIAFDQAVAIHPGTAAVVYFCGYAVNYRDRDFVLPVSAALNMPSDALTEGVVARALAPPAPAASTWAPRWCCSTCSVCRTTRRRRRPPHSPKTGPTDGSLSQWLWRRPDRTRPRPWQPLWAQPSVRKTLSCRG